MVVCRVCHSRFHPTCCNVDDLDSSSLICNFCEVFPQDPDKSWRSANMEVWFSSGQSSIITSYHLLVLPSGPEILARQERETKQLPHLKKLYHHKCLIV